MSTCLKIHMSKTNTYHLSLVLVSSGKLWTVLISLKITLHNTSEGGNFKLKSIIIFFPTTFILTYRVFKIRFTIQSVSFHFQSVTLTVFIKKNTWPMIKLKLHTNYIQLLNFGSNSIWDSGQRIMNMLNK